MNNLKENTIKAENILVSVQHKKNRELIIKLLKDEYKIQTQKNKKRHDLIIVDLFAFKNNKNQIKLMKNKEKPVYLPTLLIVSKNDKKMLDEINIIDNNIIDNIIEIPVEKSIFKIQIQNLLHTRELSLQAEKNYYRLAEKSPVGISVLSNKEILYVNFSFMKILGLDRKEILNKSILSFINDKFNEEFKKYLNEEPNNSIEILLNNHYENKWVEIRNSKILYQGKECKLLIVTDITERKKSQKEIEYISFHDKLTGLYNRAYFQEELKRLNTKRQLPLSIIMGDMNGLKLVNDAFSHNVGDELLKKISYILEDTVRDEDIVGRLGGDEFGILLPNTNREKAIKIRERIKKACNEAESKPIDLSLALGVGVKTSVEMDISDIYKEAEDRMYRNKITGSESIRNSILTTLENTLQEKTHESKEHAQRIENLAIKFHQRLNLPPDKLDELKLLAKLHDIGKVAIPENILKKPGNLSDDEYETVKEHPESGYRIVKEIPSLAHIANGILSHHEQWNGSGYPQGLKEEEIPYIARIISILDTFDVITHERSYKESQTKEQALKEIQRCAGSQFDPELVKEFIELTKENNLKIYK